MHIIYISCSTIPSLAANSIHVMKMCQAYKQLGHNIELIAIEDPTAMLADEAIDIWGFYGIQCQFLIRYIRLLKKIRPSGYALRAPLYAFLNKPDFVHSRHVRAAAICAVIGIPTVCEIHEPPKEKIYFRQLLRARHFLKLIVITHQLKREILDHFSEYLPDDKIIVCPDSVDLERFKNFRSPITNDSELNSSEKNLTIGYAGNLYPGRGIELILNLAQRCHQHQFLIMGGQPEHIRKYENMALQMRLNNIRFLGFIQNNKLPGHLASCDILLMPHQVNAGIGSGKSIAKWTSPMKMFEYMASGRVIISSDLPVLREVLNEKNAVLCHPEKIEQWLSAIRKIEKMPEWALQIAATAQKDVRQYTWKKRVEKIIKANNTPSIL